MAPARRPRDLGFDWEAQLLASQGFASAERPCSGGYGDAYEEAGYRRWATVVQDAVDATRWTVRKGKVDGGAVCAAELRRLRRGHAGGHPGGRPLRRAAGLSGVYDLTLMSWRGDIAWSRRGAATCARRWATTTRREGGLAGPPGGPAHRAGVPWSTAAGTGARRWPTPRSCATP